MAALAWLSKRPEIRASRIGMLGHSEGGLIASMAASRSRDVAFIVMLAGTAVKGSSSSARRLTRWHARPGDTEDLKKLSAQQDLLFAAVRTGQGWEAVIESARALGREQIAISPRAAPGIQDPEKALEMAISGPARGGEERLVQVLHRLRPGASHSQGSPARPGLFGSLDCRCRRR